MTKMSENIFYAYDLSTDQSARMWIDAVISILVVEGDDVEA